MPLIWLFKVTNGFHLTFFLFLNTIFVISHIYPENHKGNQVIVGSMNMGYISDTARNRTHNLFRPKWELADTTRPQSDGNCQGCGLGLDVSVSRRSRDLSKLSSRSRLGHVGKRLGLVSVSGAKVSIGLGLCLDSLGLTVWNLSKTLQNTPFK